LIAQLQAGQPPTATLFIGRGEKTDKVKKRVIRELNKVLEELEPLDDPAVRGPLIAKVVDRAVVDVAISPVSLYVACWLAAPRAGNALGGMRSLLAFHA